MKTKTTSPYLHDIPLEKALSVLNEFLEEIKLDTVLGVEEIPLDENCIGRVLVETVIAKRCSPHYNASAMDGFAVKSKDSINAKPSTPVTLRMGQNVAYVDTGDPMPEWADAVIPIENTEALDNNGEVNVEVDPRKPASIRIRSSITPWSYVRPMGEDLITGQLILASGQILRPFDLGAAAAGGATTVCVARKPIIGIIPTGDELVQIQRNPKKGEIPEFNSIVMAAQIKDWGGKPVRYPIVKDNEKALCEAVTQASEECDLVLVNAGSSAGSEDFTACVFEALGNVFVHGIAVRPGHPVVIGSINNGKKKTPAIGVPGYPVSAAMTVEIFVKPLIRRWLGLQPEIPVTIDAQFTKKVSSASGDDDFIRVVVGDVEDRIVAAPISRGAGVTSSLAKADGVVVIPRMIQGLEAGEKVSVRLFRSPQEIERNIITIGSHDLTLDILAQYLSRYDRRLVSSNSGSMGGLLAIKRHETHFSGCHLLDPVTGIYNMADIKKTIPEVPITIMKWVNRKQGLIVKKGNPKKITDLNDLIRGDVVFVNRQRGSGTRVLLDFHLKKLNLEALKIDGYDLEEYSHLGVAVAIISGKANCGLGIASAAAALDLDFIPLYDEEYQLIFPQNVILGPLVQPIFEIVKNTDFKKDILRLQGYDLVHIGECTYLNA